MKKGGQGVGAADRGQVTTEVELHTDQDRYDKVDQTADIIDKSVNYYKDIEESSPRELTEIDPESIDKNQNPLEHLNKEAHLYENVDCYAGIESEKFEDVKVIEVESGEAMSVFNEYESVLDDIDRMMGEQDDELSDSDDEIESDKKDIADIVEYELPEGKIGGITGVNDSVKVVKKKNNKKGARVTFADLKARENEYKNMQEPENFIAMNFDNEFY